MSESGAIWRLSGERARLAPLGLLWRDIATGNATIDLDRAELEARASTDVRQVTDADDELLGARARVVAFSKRRLRTVLLEPSTEGRLAAALAKFGQQPVVAYVRPIPRDVDVAAPAAAAGVRLSAAGNGPFGRQRLVLGGPRWGPFVVIVEQAATIEP